ncbi:hypothetical protein ABPG77_009993 [Micractinium sp. CCAP 211/92]
MAALPGYDVHTLDVYAFYKYWPSLALAIVALSLFGVGGLVVGGMTQWRGVYRFMHIITLVALFEMAGYACLIYSIVQSGKGDVFNAYVCTQVFIIMAPNLIQAGLYTTLGAVLKLSPQLTRGRCWLRAWVITLVFVTSDIAGIAIQTVGISIWATSQSSGNPNPDQIRKGSIITCIGLAVQIIFFCIFGLLSLWAGRHPRLGIRGHRGTARLFLGFGLVWGLVTLRNAFRFVEFVQSTVLTWPPPDNVYVIAHQQVLFYCLDALPILLTFLVFACAHPSYLLPPPAAVARQVSCEQGADPEQGQKAPVFWMSNQLAVQDSEDLLAKAARRAEREQHAQQAQHDEQFIVRQLEP